MEPIIKIGTNFWVLTVSCVLCKKLELLHLISQTLTYRYYYMFYCCCWCLRSTQLGYGKWWSWELGLDTLNSRSFSLYTFIVDIIYRWIFFLWTAILVGILWLKYLDSCVRASFLFSASFALSSSAVFLSLSSPFSSLPLSWSLYMNDGTWFFSTKWCLPTQSFKKWQSLKMQIRFSAVLLCQL